MALPYATTQGGIDLVMVDRLARGEPPLPQVEEHHYEPVARLLTERGLSSRVIADRLGVEPRSVARWRGSWASTRP